MWHDPTHHIVLVNGFNSIVARCHILDSLQLIKQVIRNTIQKTISVIKSRYYKGVNQEFSRMLRQSIPDRANPAYVEKRHLAQF